METETRNMKQERYQTDPYIPNRIFRNLLYNFQCKKILKTLGYVNTTKIEKCENFNMWGFGLYDMLY